MLETVLALLGFLLLAVLVVLALRHDRYAPSPGADPLRRRMRSTAWYDVDAGGGAAMPKRPRERER